MRKSLPAFLFLVLASPAFADPIPDYVLEKDHENCIGADAADQTKVAYCNCIRDTMKQSWTLEDYGALAEAQMKNPNQVPPKLDALARVCVAKALNRN